MTMGCAVITSSVIYSVTVPMEMVGSLSNYMAGSRLKLLHCDAVISDNG